MLTSESFKKTPLYNEHLALGAKMVGFGGWDMPVQYDGIISEYENTRKGVTVFDICHMGEFIVEGDAISSGLNFLVTSSIADMPVKTSRYGFILNEQGGVIDDLIVFRLEEKKWFIVVNAATISKDADHFKKHLTSAAKFQDVSAQTGKLDLQGPLSREVLKRFVPTIEKLEYFNFDHFDLLGEKALISRTGYTGELGYEIFYPADKTAKLWKVLLAEKEIKPAGLGARDCLRLEMGYSLYGHELSESINPIEAGLKRFVDLNKEFIGKKALLQQQTHGIKRKLIGFVSDNRRSPRSDHKIYSSSDKEIGVVTSGSYSPALNRGIGLGFVETGFETLSEKVFFGDDKNKNSAMITGKIFVKNNSLKN